MAMLFVSSCNAGGGNFCDVARPLFIDKDDVLTDGTARQILNNNEKGQELCRWPDSV